MDNNLKSKLESELKKLELRRKKDPERYGESVHMPKEPHVYGVRDKFVTKEGRTLLYLGNNKWITASDNEEWDHYIYLGNKKWIAI